MSIFVKKFPFMSVSVNLEKIKSALPPAVKLVAVSKNHPPDIVLEAYRAGQLVFGENKVQELVQKQAHLPADIEWHLIGHLQSNKVKYIAPFISMIHSVDSLKLLKEINKEALKKNRVINCLLQFHIATEETKFGLNINEAGQLLHSEDYKSMKNIAVCGVMGMATFTSDMLKVRNEFRHLAKIFNQLKQEFFQNDNRFKEISMGMSDDYKVAIEEGSTMVRIGTAVFGERQYNRQ